MATLFLLGYQSEKGWVWETAFLCLAPAAALKAYPALLSLAEAPAAGEGAGTDGEC